MSRIVYHMLMMVLCFLGVITYHATIPFLAGAELVLFFLCLGLCLRDLREMKKTQTKSKTEIFADYDKTMAEWERGFQDAT